jgi:hypothetical protein
MKGAAILSVLTLSSLVHPRPGYALLDQPQAEKPARSLPVTPLVECEEDVYTYTAADNGAGPMWCSGSTCLVRIGDEVFASGLETIKGAKPLNNCRWLLFRRDAHGWELIAADPAGRTREPCPLVAFPDGILFLSANPTLTAPDAYNGPARPEILRFSAAHPRSPWEVLTPEWTGQPPFTEHSYRSFAADGPNRELILFQNIGYTHAEWTFRSRTGRWSASGQLKWPWGAEYDKPQPIRVCYPNVALRNRAVHFCGVSDIIEPYEKWRTFKKQLTGRDWDYDFRRLFYTFTSDVATGRFNNWIEIATRDQTCGWISPCDLRVGPDGAAHLLWIERAIDERLREKFFPDVKQSHTLNYAVVRDGKVTLRRALARAEEGGRREVPAAARFHVTPDDRLFVFCYFHGRDAAGKGVSENRLFQVLAENAAIQPVIVPLKRPFSTFFTATPRAGSPPSLCLDLLGQHPDTPLTISYARIRLSPSAPLR